MSTILFWLVLLFLPLIIVSNAQYYGYNCGRGVGRPGYPIYDSFDWCCYYHDRCLEGYNIGYGFHNHLWTTRNYACNHWVASCMNNAMIKTGQYVPGQIVRGVLRENIGW